MTPNPPYLIETPRLLIRQQVEKDAAAAMIQQSDPTDKELRVWKKQIEGLEETRADIRRQLREAEAGKLLFMIIVDKTYSPDDCARWAEKQPTHGDLNALEALRDDEGLIVGMTGFNEFNRDESGKLLNVNLGILINTPVRDVGYGREALTALFNYAFDHYSTPLVKLDTAANNTAFRTFMRKMVPGVKEIEGKDEKGNLEAVFEFDAALWAAAKTARAQEKASVS